MSKRGRPKGSLARPRAVQTVSVRLSAGEAKALESLCEAWGVLATEAVRRAILLAYNL